MSALFWFGFDSLTLLPEDSVDHGCQIYNLSAILSSFNKLKPNISISMIWPMSTKTKVKYKITFKHMLKLVVASTYFCY